MDIQVTKIAASRINEVDFKNLVFGRMFSDHMFVADYYDGEWRDARIEPFGDFSLHPATSAIHYGQSIFEGLKAEKNEKGNPIVFRPLKNWKRFNTSAERMAIPTLTEEYFMTALTTLLKLDHAWIPTEPLSALYIRPFMFATEKFAGIRVADNYRFCIFTCPVGAYYSKPVNVFVSDKYTRAAPGGVGFAKAAGNYGAAMMPSSQIQKQGYDQILWLDGIEHKYVQEIGTMNILFVVDGKILTPSLEQGTILDGVTRDSVLTLARQAGYTIEERPILIDEIIEAHKSGRLTDMFGCGTAATLSPIGNFHYKGVDYPLPAAETRPISNYLKNTLSAIKSGKMVDENNWKYEIVLQ